MTSKGALVSACIMLAACSETSLPTDLEASLQPQFAAITDHLNINEPVDITAFVPCANGGAGEFVTLSGNLHTLLELTIDGRGGLHLTTHFNPQGLVGWGVTTGARYNAVGVTSDRFNGTVGQTYTARNNFRVIGQGRAPNLNVHQVTHVTVDANGQTVVQFDRGSLSCK